MNLIFTGKTVIVTGAAHGFGRACSRVPARYSALYFERNLVAYRFNKLNHFRALATRYNKLAINFLAGVHLASAMILLNRNRP